MQDDNVLQEMIERADFDVDGLVSEEEFYNLLTKKAYWALLIMSLTYLKEISIRYFFIEIMEHLIK